ncbi:hypothetical protein OK074_4617 [Actinobacteria bacterium OK074]|nr:hypothetical protein OK074_4617 [Actinobacteria bacterium OK074]
MLARLRRPYGSMNRPLGTWCCRLVSVVVPTTVLALTAAAPAWAVADLPTVITNLRNWVVGIVGGLATLFFTFGGLRYLLAGGDPGEVEAAKRALKAAAIGYGIVILAPVLLTVLKGIVGEGGQ